MAAPMGARIQGNNRAHQQTDGHRLTVPESCVRKQVADFSARHRGSGGDSSRLQRLRCPASRQSQQHRFGLRGSSESAWTNAEPLPTRTVPPNCAPTHTSVTSATAPLPTSSATTCSASPTPPTTWPPSPATSATTARPSPGTKKQRRHLRARLDALYFHLYGLDRDAAAYILSTFPIIQRQDQAQFNHYRTKDLILAYMNALAAGDTESQVAV